MSRSTPPLRATAPTSDDTPTLEATSAAKTHWRSSVISVCHVLNHLQYSITSVMFPVMMTELGFGLLQLGALSAISNFVGQGLQVVYGLFTGMFKRTVILGAGNVIVGISAIAQYFVGSYPQLVGRPHRHRCRIEPAASARREHSVALLSQGARLGADVSSLGRQLRFFHRPGASVHRLALHGLANRVRRFWRGEPGHGTRALSGPRARVGAPMKAKAGKANFKANLDAYRICLKNRNILFTSLVLMVGAAGRGTGINLTYLVPFFMERFDVTAPVGGLFLTVLQGAGLVGPLAIAWVSDRLGRRAMITQITLLLCRRS